MRGRRVLEGPPGRWGVVKGMVMGVLYLEGSSFSSRVARWCCWLLRKMRMNESNHSSSMSRGKPELLNIRESVATRGFFGVQRRGLVCLC